LSVVACYGLVNVPKVPYYPCTIASQFQTIVEVVSTADRCNIVYEYAQLYYDFDNGMYREDLIINYDAEISMFSIYADYNTMTGYYYDRVSNICESFELTGEMEEFQIPDNAQFAGSFGIGMQEMDSWSVNDTDYVEIISVTSETCYPVSILVLNSTSGGLVETQTMWNYLPGVPPFIFDLPDSCSSSIVKQGVTLMSKKGITSKKRYFGLFQPIY